MNLRMDNQKKKEIYTARPFTNLQLFYGIVDDLGIDCIHRPDDHSPPANILAMRCRLNSPRNPKLFTCGIKEEHLFDMHGWDPKKLEEKIRKVCVFFNEAKDNEGLCI